MCHTTQDEQMPLETPGAAQMGDLGQLNIPGLSGPATNAVPGQSADASPTTVSVKRPTKFGRFTELATMGGYDPTGGEDTTAPPGGKLTKFGALVHVLGPALQGGLIGLASGKGHPGGGFGAAQDYFDRQRAFEMQRTLLSRQLLNDQFRNALEYARTQHTLSQPNFNGRGAAPIKGRDESGKLVYMRPNPQTGVYEPIEGLTPDEADNSRAEMTDQGLVSVNPRTATARRVTLPMLPGGGPSETGASMPPENNPLVGNSFVPTTPPGRFNSGSPRIPLKPGVASQSPNGIKMGASQGGIPLRPPSYSTPKATIRASRNGAGVESDNLYDANPNSPTFGQRIGTTGNTRQPLPDRSQGTRNRRDADTARVEQYAGAALAKAGGDPDKAIQSLNGLSIADPDAAKDFRRLLPQVRRSITDRARTRKPKTRNPLGLSDQDWHALTGNQTQPNQDQAEQ